MLWEEEWRERLFITVHRETIDGTMQCWSCRRIRYASVNLKRTAALASVTDPCTVFLQTLCFRGKCILTCLYGRVEVMGFTIEEGQKSYPLFSPASHCPLTIRAMETSHFDRDHRTDVSRILQAHLHSGSLFLVHLLLPFIMVKVSHWAAVMQHLRLLCLQ